MDLSYAQHLEDYHLASVFADQGEGFYIDVGAGHPVADNVSCWFYQRGWRGIVVEPQPQLAALYASIRPRDVAECCVLGQSPGEVEFHDVERLHGFSTIVPEFAESATGFGAPANAFGAAPAFGASGFGGEPRLPAAPRSVSGPFSGLCAAQLRPSAV
jgi:hypothetical protein